ncbi:hypothetical protein HD597_000627 [Nonomuraea thailandensis]|uniref:Uncharacterized protein n=1 Tax=Nonomuraea thailandensis TaxID=1188745 RepID=A0A9X2G9M3_9ACTN|nr:hypothetical protein [Nonomuraea thailandensis]MCP2353607.1 hypothetical protein [Nonomuraea thailandensis]
MGQAPALYGDAMVQLHSRRGFLRRLREGDRVIATVRDAWERPIRSLMHELGVPDDRFDETLFLYNALFDPREVLDLIDSGLSQEEALRHLTDAFYGAIRAHA